MRRIVSFPMPSKTSDTHVPRYVKYYGVSGQRSSMNCTESLHKVVSTSPSYPYGVQPGSRVLASSSWLVALRAILAGKFRARAWTNSAFRLLAADGYASGRWQME